MKRFIKIWLVLFILGIHGSGWAQTQDQYVYQDSTVLGDAVETDSLSTSIVENATDDLLKNYQPEAQNDTVLTLNHLMLSKDSINAIKKAVTVFDEYGLDTTLRILQKQSKKKESDQSNDDYRSNPPKEITLFGSNVVRAIIWGLAIGFVLFVIFQLFFSESILQRKTKKAPVVVEQTETEELDLSTDYEALKAKAVKAGDYRMAVRYHYLQTLQKLSNKELVHFSPDKTNYQYVRELSDKSMGPAFARLTLEYEYVWFGKFELDQPLYQQINQHFSQFNQQL